MDDFQKLKESFFNEAQEIVDTMDGLMLDLEAEPENMDTLGAIFRQMHTMKGSSGIFDFHVLTRFAHVQEDLLDQMRNGKVEVTSDIIDVFFECLDRTKVLVSMAQEGNEPEESIVSDLMERVRSFLPAKGAAPAGPADVEVVEGPKVRARDSGISRIFINNLPDDAVGEVVASVEDSKNLYQVKMLMNESCIMEGLDPLMLLRSLRYEGDIPFIRINTDNVPDITKLDETLLYFGEILFLYTTECSINEVDDVFEFAHDAGIIEIHHFTPKEVGEFFDVEVDSFWAEAEDVSEEESMVPEGLSPQLFFDETEGNLRDLLKVLPSIVDVDKEDEKLNRAFRLFHTIRGNAALFGLTAISTIATTAETILGKIRDGNGTATEAVVESLLKTAEEIQHIFVSTDASDLEGLQVSEKAVSGGEASSLLGDILIGLGDITEDQLDEALQKQKKPLGEILVEEGMVKASEVEKALEVQKSAGVKPRVAIRVDTDKLDNLVNLVGELVINQTMLGHNESLKNTGDGSINKTLGLLEKITRDIQDQVMGMRMLPIKASFQKLMRVARDVSRKAGKDVDIQVVGEDTELDKTVIDEIGDPLVHIMRNACDHGLEPPEERIAAGKDPKGIVRMSAYHQGGNIVIEIMDDGRGLDKKKLLAKATERGIAREGVEYTDEQIFGFIFQAGFSTAKVVSDVSGRGVGMDVVKRNIEKLRGKVDIASVYGKGSTFTIRLPLTLAIIDGMVIQVGTSRYIVPTISIIESFKPTRDEISTVQGKGEVVRIRENLYPLIRLHKLFNVEPVNVNPWESIVILVEGEGLRGCFLVDDLLGQQQVVIKSLGEVFKGLKGIAGSAIMGDGNVGLILDTGGALSLSMLN